jgi:hypothetical protein
MLSVLVLWLSVSVVMFSNLIRLLLHPFNRKQVPGSVSVSQHLPIGFCLFLYN